MFMFPTVVGGSYTFCCWKLFKRAGGQKCKSSGELGGSYSSLVKLEGHNPPTPPPPPWRKKESFPRGFETLLLCSEGYYLRTAPMFGCASLR